MIEGVVQEIFPDFHSVSISLPMLVPPTRKPHVYFALDISGSMGGDKIEIAKESVLQLINTLEPEGVHLTLIAFDDQVRLKDSRDIGFAGMREFCQSLGACGGTRFVNVFASLKDEITKHNDTNVGVVFVSDGCDNDGIQIVGPCMEGFQKWMNEKNLLAAVHAIGLGSDHDANMLTNVIKFGTMEGTFQYVADFDEIFSAVEVLTGLLLVRGGWGHVVAGENKYKISLPYHKETNSMEGTVFLKGGDIKHPLKAQLMIEGEHREYAINQVAQKNELTPQMFNAFAREQLRSVIDALKAGGVTEANRSELLKFIMAINTKAVEMAKMLKVAPPSEQALKAMMPYCTSIIMLSTELAAILTTSLKGVIGNEAVARLYDLLFQGVLGGRIRKKMQKLLVQGEAFKKACEFVEKYGFKDIPENERQFSKSKFDICVNPVMPSEGISFTLDVFGKGKDLGAVFDEFGKPMGMGLEQPFMTVAFVKKSAAPVKPLVEDLLNQAWDMGSALDPDMATVNNMIERKFGENDKKVFCVLTRSAAMEAEVKPLIETLKSQAAIKIEGQYATLHLKLATDFSKLLESSKPSYHGLAEGIRLGGEASVLTKLSSLPLVMMKALKIRTPLPMGKIFGFAPLKSLDGELVFDIDANMLAMMDEKLEGTPFTMPLKDARMMFGGMVMQMISQSETLKKAYEFVKTNLEGIEISIYAAGLFGGALRIKLPGLGALLDIPQ